jgi:cobalt transporter subunit CbtB
MKFDPTVAGSGDTVAHATSQTIPAIAAILLGVLFLLGTGFIPVEAVHNAAHDTRHAFAFPCH